MIKKLYSLCENKEKVSLYTDYNESNNFSFGTILAVNDAEIAINMLTPDGEDDGIKVIDTESVFKVEEKGQYHEKMEKLCSMHNPVTYSFNIIDDDIMKSAVLFALNEERIASIELRDSGYFDVVGYVKSVDSDDCEIQVIDEYGYEDGICYISLYDITSIQTCSQDEKRIEKLIGLSG